MYFLLLLWYPIKHIIPNITWCDVCFCSCCLFKLLFMWKLILGSWAKSPQLTVWLLQLTVLISTFWMKNSTNSVSLDASVDTSVTRKTKINFCSYHSFCEVFWQWFLRLTAVDIWSKCYGLNLLSKYSKITTLVTYSVLVVNNLWWQHFTLLQR